MSKKTAQKLMTFQTFEIIMKIKTKLNSSNCLTAIKKVIYLEKKESSKKFNNFFPMLNRKNSTLITLEFLPIDSFISINKIIIYGLKWIFGAILLRDCL